MKPIVIILFLCLIARATEVAVFVSGSGGEMPPGVTATANFIMTGVDQIHVWINGVDKGILRAPFQATYTSASSGSSNTFVIEYCDWAGRTGTNTYYNISANRTYPIRPLR